MAGGEEDEEPPTELNSPAARKFGYANMLTSPPMQK